MLIESRCHCPPSHASSPFVQHFMQTAATQELDETLEALTAQTKEGEASEQQVAKLTEVTKRCPSNSPVLYIDPFARCPTHRPLPRLKPRQRSKLPPWRLRLRL